MNARINIKYNENSRPKISFSYPSKKNQVTGSMKFEWKMVTLLISAFVLRNFTPDHIETTVLTLLSSWYIAGPLTYKFIVKKPLERFYPFWQASISSRKLAVFTEKDIKQNDGKIYVEIPVFSNVVLDFRTEGEFSDYLDEIDIREHKFVYFRRSGKHKVNEWLWYARFYFKEVPTKGKIKVLFR